MEGLSPKLRAAIVLTTLHNLSIPEAAKVEGCSVPTLYWRVHEARRQLAKRMAARVRAKVGAASAPAACAGGSPEPAFEGP